ncbi:MAG TPA: cytidine deaminase [Bacteroidota bacterium]|nr:cytidine deaminase [Bacteroidota bacterium]
MPRSYRDLALAARRARLKAYAPYSKFRVGAAVLTHDGEVYTGCNVENSSYGLAMCAERTAIFKAVSEGARKFRAVAVSAETQGFTAPCGACRQVLLEFAPNADVILINRDNRLKILKVNSLIPMGFTAKDLKSKTRRKK